MKRTNNQTKNKTMKINSNFFSKTQLASQKNKPSSQKVFHSQAIQSYFLISKPENLFLKVTYLTNFLKITML